MKTSKQYLQVSTAGLCKDPLVQAQAQPMRDLWRVHVQGCLRRNVANLISIADYAALSRQVCAYCGRPPFNMTKFKNNPIAYNGVDRVDNSRPYAHGNLVTCCKICNSMKSKMTVEEFLEHVARITAHQSTRVFPGLIG